MTRRLLGILLLLILLVVVVAGLTWRRAGTELHSVTLTWNEPPPSAASKVVSYNVYRKTGDTGYLRIATRVPGLSYVDRMVISGETYCYVVTAVDQANRESKFSPKTEVEVP